MCRLVRWRDYRWGLVGGGEVSLSSMKWTGSSGGEAFIWGGWEEAWRREGVKVKKLGDLRGSCLCPHLGGNVMKP